MKANRLINEKSQYLRQHAYNPVDWYPWNEEAFEKAKRENKPIFLSIGYFSCHWCHVMEKESFEDIEVAEILNKFFVSIKVDREERPDIDNFYMKVCYLFNNRGGWPLTVFLTPDKKPFFADTYIPKEDIYGRIGLKTLLLRIIDIWENNREKINEVSESIIDTIKNIINKPVEDSELSEVMIHKAYETLRVSFDRNYGGFGKSPKFPLPLNMLFLHRYFYRYKNKEALDMSLQTLKKMRLGGIYDHIGFGFHRYSTDRFWILPHFEKMLYDNALLLVAYTEAYQITQEKFYKSVAEEIIKYLLRDMYSPQGVFYSSEDADSEGEEGKFYIWDYYEIMKELNSEEFEFVRRLYPIKKDGNFYDEATKQKRGKNIIYLENSIEDIAKNLKMKEIELIEKVETIRSRLFHIRQKKVKPQKDEKILTDWNSLAIWAFCKAGVVFEKEEYIEIAEKCANFINTKMFDNAGRLLHRYSEGEASIYGYLEDYAYFILALIELYFSTFKGEYLKEAVELTNYTLNHFWDEKGGGFYHTADYSEVIIERNKENYDGVTPSGNSTMVYNLIRLSRLTGNIEYEKKAMEALKSFKYDIENTPISCIFSIIALDLLINGSVELFIIPFKSEDEEREYCRNLQKIFIPNLLILIKSPSTQNLSYIIGEFKAIDEKPTYYLCKNFICQFPIIKRQDIIKCILNDHDKK